MNKHKWIFGFIIAILFVICLLFLFACWSMNSLPVPKSQAEKIVSGMTKENVSSILGQPNQVQSTADSNSETWIYSHTFQWSMFLVDFNDKGLVSESYYDY